MKVLTRKYPSLKPSPTRGEGTFPPYVVEFGKCIALSGLKILLNPYPRAVALVYTLSALRALPCREKRALP